MKQDRINVAIIGVGFGKEFIPIYQHHKNAGEIAICTRNPETLKTVGDQFNIAKHLRFTNFNDVVSSPNIDAVHIVTPILEHYRQTIASLEAGKHTACTVPMATSLEECRNIVNARRQAERVYMMMETSLFTREYIYVKNMLDSGQIGRIQFIRSDHMQNMALEGWGDYWRGFPPFHYGTHALSPVFRLLDRRAESVVCHGSGSLSKDKAEKYGSPWAVETATFRFSDSDVIAESSRCLFETIRQCRESFDVYGTKTSFEWEQIIDDGHVLFENIDDARKIEVPDTDYLLPPEIASFTRRSAITDTEHSSFRQGIGHGGSHPHLVHEFLMAILDSRKSSIDAVLSAQITGAGICAHQSALANGERVVIPDFNE